MNFINGDFAFFILNTSTQQVRRPVHEHPKKAEFSCIEFSCIEFSLEFVTQLAKTYLQLDKKSDYPHCLKTQGPDNRDWLLWITPTDNNSELGMMLSPAALSFSGLAAGFAHDLNNSLSILIGNSNLIQKKLQKNNIDLVPYNDSFERIKKSAERMVNSINVFRELAQESPATTDPATQTSYTAEDLWARVHGFYGTRLTNHSVTIKRAGDAWNTPLHMNLQKHTQEIIAILDACTRQIDKVSDKWIELQCKKSTSGLTLELRHSAQIDNKDPITIKIQ